MGYYLIYDITINIALYSPDDFLISAMSEFEITKRLKYTHPNVSNESEKQKSWRLLPEHSAVHAVLFFVNQISTRIPTSIFIAFRLISTKYTKLKT